MERKHVLFFFLSIVTLIFAYFSYRQNELIEVLDQEIVKLANQKQKVLVEKYALQKELELLKLDFASEDSTTVQNDSVN